MESKKFVCNECEKSFSEKRYLSGHVASSHEGRRFRCPQCGSMFMQMKGLKNHHQKQHNDIICLYCNGEFMNQKSLLAKEHCQKCLTVKPDGNMAVELEEKLEDNGKYIPEEDELPHDVAEYPGDAQDQIKHCWVTNHGDVKAMLEDIYRSEKECFRINGAIGCLLKNRESDQPVLIKNGQDLKQLADTMGNIDFEEKFTRPDTKWALYLISNVEFYVIPQKNFVPGCKDFSLPGVVSHQQNNLLGMTYDSQGNKFTDNLCLFRCIAQCLTGTFENKNHVFELFVKYCQNKKIPAIVESFSGVPYTDLEMIEKLFHIDIQVFHLDPIKEAAVCWKNVVQKYNKLLNLDVSFVENGKAHYSYIVNLDQYSKRYSCLSCSRLFKKREKLNDHAKNHCHEGKTVHKFPGGMYMVKKSMFEQLNELEIIVNESQHFCPFYAVYDFEAILVKKPHQSSEKLTFLAEHQPVSCAIATNVPGFDPICFVEENPDVLVQKMVQHLELISFRQNSLLSNQHKVVFERLDAMISSCKAYVQELCDRKKDFRREKGYLNSIIAVKTA